MRQRSRSERIIFLPKNLIIGYGEIIRSYGMDLCKSSRLPPADFLAVSVKSTLETRQPAELVPKRLVFLQAKRVAEQIS